VESSREPVDSTVATARVPKELNPEITANKPKVAEYKIRNLVISNSVYPFKFC